MSATQTIALSGIGDAVGNFFSDRLRDAVAGMIQGLTEAVSALGTWFMWIPAPALEGSGGELTPGERVVEYTSFLVAAVGIVATAFTLIAIVRRRDADGVIDGINGLIRVTEWWQEKPEGVPGTFRLDIGVLESGITEEMFESLTLLIDDAKPVSRHLTGLAIVLETRGRTYVGATALHGDTTTVYPYEPGPIEVSAPAILQGGAAHIIDIMSVYP